MNGHRHTLTRDLGTGRDEILLWVMLNPSTADDTVDDPTIRRVKAFTAREGYRWLTVVNLFSQRATKPKHLRSPTVEEFQANYDCVSAHLSTASRIVAAWGAGIPRDAQFSAEIMVSLIKSHAPDCLGKTIGGHPRHPLYVHGDTPLVPY